MQNHPTPPTLTLDNKTQQNSLLSNQFEEFDDEDCGSIMIEKSSSMKTRRKSTKIDIKKMNSEHLSNNDQLEMIPSKSESKELRTQKSSPRILK